MTNNEGNQKYRMTDTVQCNSVSVGALRNIYKFSGILRKFDQFKLVKYENHFYFNINNVTNKVHL